MKAKKRTEKLSYETSRKRSEKRLLLVASELRGCVKEKGEGGEKKRENRFEIGRKKGRKIVSRASDGEE